jgi:hypothetical protein
VYGLKHQQEKRSMTGRFGQGDARKLNAAGLKSRPALAAMLYVKQSKASARIPGLPRMRCG